MADVNEVRVYVPGISSPSEEIKQKIVDWIVENHSHHDGGRAAVLDLETGEHSIQDNATCNGGDYPYVNSLELERFIRSL